MSTSITTAAPAPTVTVTEFASPDVDFEGRTLTDQNVSLLRLVCELLEEIPSEAAVSEYEPQPDSGSAQESLFLAERFHQIAQSAFDILKDSDALGTTMGKWISADAIGYDTVASALKSSASSWLTNPTPKNYTYWVEAFGYGVYKVQEPRACASFFDLYGE